MAKLKNHSLRIKEIPQVDLKKKVLVAIKKLVMDNTQPVVGEEFSYMVASVTNELITKHPSLMYGEFLYALDVGSEGKYGKYYKINSNCIKQWLFQYKAEQVNKRARANEQAAKKIERNPMAPFMAAAVRLRMNNAHLRSYELKKVAMAIKNLKTESANKILNHLDNE